MKHGRQSQPWGRMAAAFFLLLLVSSTAVAEYQITLTFPQGGQPYKAPSQIPAELLANINDTYVLADNVELVISSGFTDYPSAGSYWGCWGATGRDDANRRLGATQLGYIQSGNRDYAFIFGHTGHGGDAYCAPGKRWLAAAQRHVNRVNGVYLELVRVAQSGDSSVIHYPSVHLCLIPSNRDGSELRRCEKYVSRNNNSAWWPSHTTAVVVPTAASHELNK